VDFGVLALHRGTSKLKLDCDFNNRPLSDVVSFLREFCGVNIVTRGTESLTPVTLTLRNVKLEGVLNHVSGTHLAARPLRNPDAVAEAVKGGLLLLF
jgi:5-enolpyruvylshikimate-3-phosphate synthase